MPTAAAAALAVAAALSCLTWHVAAMDFGVPALGSQSGEPGFLMVSQQIGRWHKGGVKIAHPKNRQILSQ